MKYQTLLVRCKCGRPTTRLRNVGFTADHQLVLHWRCKKCKRYAYVLMPLAECWRDCPRHEDLEGRTEVSEEVISEIDERFLHELGITM
jgi:hypothetical protein